MKITEHLQLHGLAPRILTFISWTLLWLTIELAQLHDGICRFLYFIIALGEALREAVRGSSGIAQLYNGLGPPNINFALGEALGEAFRGSSGIAYIDIHQLETPLADN